jgi:hypothetical protein
LKTGLLPGINLILSILAVAFCFIPLALYWWKKLAPDKVYLTIVIFWTINGILYFPEIFHWEWYTNVTNRITLFYNLVEDPLILVIFYFLFRNHLFKFLLPAFILFEIIIILWKGFNWDANNIIIGVGGLICLVLNIWGISRYFLKMQHTDPENVMGFVYAGFIFYFGLYGVIYYFNYIIFSKVTLPYVIFINYLAICLATILISIGFWKFAHADYRDEGF